MRERILKILRPSHISSARRNLLAETAPSAGAETAGFAAFRFEGTAEAVPSRQRWRNPARDCADASPDPSASCTTWDTARTCADGNPYVRTCADPDPTFAQTLSRTEPAK